MQFSIQLPIDWHDDGRFLDGPAIARLAGEIEAAGFDACFVTEHPAPTSQWLGSGGHHTLDPFVALSFAAAGSSRLRLHTNILVLSYRNPLLTAKAVASLDVLSGGRVICGVGVGYMEGEFRALGADFGERGRRSDEALAVMQRAWLGEPVAYRGETFEAQGNVVQPKPIQQPHPPVWVGGNSERAIRRAVQFGDGWCPFPTKRAGVTAALATIDDLAARIQIARELCDEAGRQLLDVCMVPFGWAMTSDGDAMDTAALADQLHALEAIGVTWTVLALACDNEAVYRRRLGAIGEQVLPALQ